MYWILQYIGDHLADPVFLAFWLLGIPYFGVLFFPESRYTKRVVFGFVFICGILYIALILRHFPNLLYVVYHCYSTADGFRDFTADAGARFASYLQIIGWDVLVGYWISIDARRAGFPDIARIPFLCVYMHFPPCSFAIYLLARLARTGGLPQSHSRSLERPMIRSAAKAPHRR